MKVVLLGTGGYHPSEQRHTACMMLPSEGIVLDAGTAMFRIRDWIQGDSLDLLLSHAHLDHVVGLTYAYDFLFKTNVSRVNAYAEPDKIRSIQKHLFADHIFPVDLPIDFLPLDDLPVLGNGCRVTYFPLEHPGGSVGFRLDWADRSLAYVTDTVADPQAEYVELISGVDLLIHECYFSDNQQEYAVTTGHSWGTAVGQVAAKAQVGRLALVHVNPVFNEIDPIGLETVQEIFPDTVLGVDEMELDF